jgi:hypothetical protein
MENDIDGKSNTLYNKGICFGQMLIFFTMISHAEVFCNFPFFEVLLLTKIAKYNTINTGTNISSNKKENHYGKRR